MRPRGMAAVAVLALLLAACAPAAPTAAPTVARPTAATPTATPVATAPLPSGATPQPSPTPRAIHTAAPAAGPKRGGIAKIIQLGDPIGWDAPALSGGQSVIRRLFGMVFGQLVIVPATPQTGCSLAPANDLAESWKWLDPLTLEIKVRQGVKFQNRPPVNGREMTAEDAAYSLRRWLDKQGRAGAMASYIGSIEATDKYTVVIRMAQSHGGVPGLTFLANFYNNAVLAKESGGPKESWESPSTSWIGTGPFMFKEYVPGVRISFERNPNYWKSGLPYLDGMDWVIMPDSSLQLASLSSGKVDIHTWAVSQYTVRELRKRVPGINVLTCMGGSVSGTFIRTDQPPLNDIRVRRAISMAIDRKALLANVWGGEGGLVPVATGHPWYIGLEEVPQEVRQYMEYRPDEAKRLLAEAGYPGGTGLEITVNHTLGRHARAWEEWTEFQIAALNQVGIKAIPNWMDYGRYSATVLVGEYRDLGTGGLTQYDPYQFLSQFLSTTPAPENRSRVNDPEMDKFLKEYMGTVDQARAKELARQIQLRILSQVYLLVPPANLNYFVSQPWVKDMGPVPLYPFSASWAEIIWFDK